MEKTTSGEVVREGFPADVDEFDADDRVSFSKTDGKWILETDEGTEYEWDNALKRWIQAVGCMSQCLKHNALSFPIAFLH